MVAERFDEALTSLSASASNYRRYVRIQAFVKPGLTGALSFLLATPLAALPPLQRSISSSRQFVVYGADPSLRGLVCELAEASKANLLHALQQRDQWGTPIVINLRYPEANLPEVSRAQISLGQTGFGLKLQLDLLITRNFQSLDVEKDVLKAVVLEMMYRHEPGLPAGVAYVEPPVWLIEGLAGSRSTSDTEHRLHLLDGFTSSGKVLSLAEFLRQRPELLDSTSREIYRAYALGLLEILRNAPDGSLRLSRWIADLPHARADPLADLQSHFPLLEGDADKIEESWKSGLARLGASTRFHPSSIRGTEEELETLLQVRFVIGTETKDYRLEQFAAFMKLPGRPSVLASRSDEFLLLAARANPIYRSLIRQYQLIAAQLARGETRGIGRRLAGLEKERGAMARRVRAIDDYMNWFEATQLHTESGAFTAYLQSARASAKTESRRRDPISVYLDSVEAQFHLEP